MIAVVLITIFLLLIFSRIPISVSMGISTLAAMLVGGNYDSIYIIPQQMVEGVNAYALLAIPFFILAGSIMNHTGLTDKIFNFATALVGHMRGGLAQVNVVASMVFSGVSGAALADCAGLGVVEIKAMRERGYDPSFAAAITVASSSCGPIIPPSIPLVIYAVLANVSIAKLFLGGIAPGLLIGIALMITNVVLSYKLKNFPLPEKRIAFRNQLIIARDGIFALIAPVVIIGGIVGGFVNVTEAGVLAIDYALLAGIIYKGPWKVLKTIPLALFDAVKMTVIIMFLIACSTSMGWILAIEQIPQLIADAMISIAHNKYIFLVMVNIFLLVLGTVVEVIPAMLITVPILLPVIDIFGIDRIHFGLVAVYGLIIGITTPPMGVGLYLVSGISGERLEKVIRSTLPFLIPLIIVLIIITYFPKLVLFLPDVFMKNN